MGCRALGKKTNVRTDKDGMVMADLRAQSDRWAEYFEEMFNSC